MTTTATTHAASPDGATVRIPALAATLFTAARVAAVAAATALATWLVIAAGFPSSFPPTPLVATLGLIPVNIATLLVASRLLRRTGSSLAGLIGFDRSRFGRDVLWGLLWLAVLYLPFVASIMGTMFALHGADAFERFETVFVPEVVPGFPVEVAAVLGAVAVLTFAPLNAPAEEVAYRGIGQGALQSSGRPALRVLAVLVPSALFGIQHLFFAPSPSAMVVYGVAFFVWGLGSALIYRRQRRLMPLIVSHFLVNVMSTLPALILPLVLPEAL